jgi:uncharacterized protein
MPHGKPAGVRCIQLGSDERCMIFGQPERPTVCLNLRPEPMMCGETREQALLWLQTLELRTQP